ncbi:MAG TPA: glucose 1-dehydrogenase [Syntrophales bacterium]|nr:glucose 1-dehydrogenase [Syntrophales bacterium]
MASSNKVAIVTGGGRGIGKGITKVFLKHGIDVVIAGRNFEKLEQTAKEMKFPGVEVFPVKTDVAVQSDVEHLFDETIKKFGKVDILINNAGIAEPMAPITDIDMNLVEDIININFKGVFYCARRAAKEMKARKSGNIINIGSVEGLISLPGIVYGPMKAAVHQFTKVLARELAAIPIRVNCITPGLVLTEMMDELTDRDVEVFLKYIPMHKALLPEDVGNLAYFLVSDEARYITGSIVTADSGITADGGWYAFGL